MFADTWTINSLRARMVLDRVLNMPSDGPWSQKQSGVLHFVQSKVVHFGKKIFAK